jgi:hypothetical protein
MKKKPTTKKTFLTAAIAIACLFFYTPVFSDDKGLEIMKKNDQLKEPSTRKGASIMVIINGDKKDIKEFNMVAKKYGEKTRSRSTFTKPTRLEFLSWSEPGEDSLQWIKLSGGSVRKIASSDKNGAFVGSHFYYEDLADRDINDFDFTYLGEAKIEGEDCYKIQSVKKVGTKVYEKSIAYVRKSDYVIIRAELFEKKGHTKTMIVEKIENIDGVLTPRKITMERTDGKGKTIIYTKTIEYNVAVSDEFLKKESL